MRLLAALTGLNSRIGVFSLLNDRAMQRRKQLDRPATADDSTLDERV